MKRLGVIRWKFEKIELNKLGGQSPTGILYEVLFGIKNVI